MLRSMLGLVSLVVGLIGLVLPFIPGIPFLILAWLLLRRGDGHWRRHAGWQDRRLDRGGDDRREEPYRGSRRYVRDVQGEMSLPDRLRLRALQGTSGALRHLQRAEQQLLGQGVRRQ